MKIDVLWTPSELERVPVHNRNVIVVDVLRSATTVAVAIHNGARAVVPAASIEEALRIANSIGRADVILCGERQGIRIEGFDLGNSPSEFKSGVIGDRTIVMTTTNGTHVLTSLSAARAVYVGALVNLSAVAKQLREDDGEPLIVCAGRGGRVSVEDALCAGLLVEAYLKRDRRKRAAKTVAELGDGAVAALSLAREHGPVSTRFLRETAAGRALEKIGQGEDIKFCGNVDSIPEVPVLRDRQIIRAEPANGQTSGGKKTR
ncbi:MAG: 2-phosphosulfolactate phosphatase [Gemmatimonadota bacterium]|nr:MAG: 2-phosphosulfolactate phosphatase [Gemmatimonadota bacterium]